ncbi:MAG TPA: hypothetical protein DCE23_01375 [Firmicutes bacterium]|nr:hypothetical protein [Bacillota bacterium]
MGKYYNSLKKIRKSDIYRNATKNKKLRKKLQNIYKDEDDDYDIDIRDVPKKLNKYFDKKYDKERVEELPTVIIFNDRVVINKRKSNDND